MSYVGLQAQDWFLNASDCSAPHDGGRTRDTPGHDITRAGYSIQSRSPLSHLALHVQHLLHWPNLLTHHSPCGFLYRPQASTASLLARRRPSVFSTGSCLCAVSCSAAWASDMTPSWFFDVLAVAWSCTVIGRPFIQASAPYAPLVSCREEQAHRCRHYSAHPS